VEKNPCLRFNVDIPPVDTIAELTVSEDRTIDEARMEDPTSVEN
jgi:hypothetical protein